MDMLYRAYSNPLDLMNRYINQGRFGKFVTGFLEAEYDRRKEEAEKDENWKLWIMYVHSYSEKSFGEWKSEVIKNAKTDRRNANKDYELTNDGIKSIISGLFPS
jgi:hypothetical protein